MNPGYYPNIPAAEYHAGPGVSKSHLDLIAKAPALLLWSRSAPYVGSPTMDLGTAFHTLVLEPERFACEYVVAPDVDRRTKDGKAEWADFVAATETGGLTVIAADDRERLAHMRASLYAHPVARNLLTADGDVEASIYWTDPETGELCRCRPDKLVPSRRVILDVKTADDVDRFDKSLANYRYHVQHAHYTDGVQTELGGEWAFLFIVVSTSLSAGRYPVRVFQLDPTAVDAGARERRENLNAYAASRRSDRWPGIEILSLPRWAA